MNPNIIPCFVMGLLSLVACSGEQKLVGTDTGNPVITVSLRDAQGLPLQNAQLYISTQGSLGSVIIDSLQTDSLGRAQLALPVGDYGIEARWQDSLGVFATQHISGTQGSLDLVAKPMVSFPVASSLNGAPLWATLLESGRTLPAGSHKVPQGLYRVSYMQYTSGVSVALPPLQVDVVAANGAPGAFLGLSQAAYKLQQIQVQTKDYVGQLDLPPLPEGIGFMEKGCANGQQQLSDCAGGACRVWLWTTDLYSKDATDQEIFAAAVTGADGGVKCVTLASRPWDNTTNPDNDQLIFFERSDVELRGATTTTP